METLKLNPIRRLTLALAAGLALAPPAFAGDVSVKLDAGSGFSIRDNTGNSERLRVDEATGDISRNGALFLHSTGTNNLFVGADAGNAATPDSDGNTAVGTGALFSNTTGFSNSAFGDQALHFNLTGNRNVAIGQYAGENQTTGSDNVYLANPGVAEESGRIRIGSDPTHTATFIAGIDGADVGSSALPVFVNASGQLGTSGASLPPWNANMDAAGFGITGLGDIELSPLATATAGSWISGTQSETGLTWRLGFEPGGHNDFSGLTTNTRMVNGFNLGIDGKPDSPFAHAVGLVNESSYFNGSGTNFGVWYENVTNAYRQRSTTVLTSKSVDFDLSVGEMLSVREPANGMLLATGEVRSWDGTTVDIIWLTPVDRSDPGDDPAPGDEIETPSTTTVTDRTGTFNDSNIVWVYANGEPCGTNETGAVAAFFNRAIANQTGTTADLTMVQVRGLGTDLTAGRCVRQKATGAMATLGPVTRGDTALLGMLSNSSDVWRPGPIWNLDTTHQWADFEVHTSPVAQAAGRAFRVRSTHGPNYVPYGMFNATWTASDGESDTMFRFGDDATVPGPIPYNHLAVAFHGPIKLWRGAGPFNFHYLRPTAGPGTVNNLLPPVNGTLGAFTDLNGCADDSVVLASGATGGLKCGAAAGGGAVSTEVSRITGTAPAAAGARGPVIGAVSDGGTFDTPEELCDVTYASSAESSQTCVAGSAKRFGASAPAAYSIAMIACTDTVDPGVYFEVVCNVE